MGVGEIGVIGEIGVMGAPAVYCMHEGEKETEEK